MQAGAYGLFSSNGNISISKDVTIKSSYNSIYAPNGAVNIASGATWKMDSSGYTIYAKDIIIPSGSAIIEPADGEISESGSSKHTPSEHVIIGPAVVKYPVWVSGIRVTEANKSNVLGDGNVSYDPASKTLTVLDGTNITEGYSYAKALIYSDEEDTLTIDAPKGLTLNSETAMTGVKTKNALIINNNVDITIDGGYGDCIYSGGSVTIGGNAKFVVTDECQNAITANGDININGNVEITPSGEGIFDKGIYAYGNLKVTGNVTATAKDGALYASNTSGIEVDGNVTITITGTGSAIQSSSGSILIGGDVKITGTTGATAIAHGSLNEIRVNGDLEISGFNRGVYTDNGTVTVNANIKVSHLAEKRS